MDSTQNTDSGIGRSRREEINAQIGKLLDLVAEAEAILQENSELGNENVIQQPTRKRLSTAEEEEEEEEEEEGVSKKRHRTAEEKRMSMNEKIGMLLNQVAEAQAILKEDFVSEYSGLEGGVDH